MKLSEAADLTGVTKQTIWRAVKAGKLEATRINRGGKKAEFDVTKEALETYRQDFLDATVTPVVTDVSDVTHENFDDVTDVTDVTDIALHPVTDVALEPNMPAIYLGLVDRLTRAECRNVELEFIVRQHKNLLTENSESLQENRAKVLQAEAKVEVEKTARAAKESELALLSAELKEARTQIAEWSERRRPWWRRVFNAG